MEEKRLKEKVKNRVYHDYPEMKGVEPEVVRELYPDRGENIRYYEFIFQAKENAKNSPFDVVIAMVDTSEAVVYSSFGQRATAEEEVDIVIVVPK
jgi:hypothetical protein